MVNAGVFEFGGVIYRNPSIAFYSCTSSFRCERYCLEHLWHFVGLGTAGNL